MSTPTPAPAPVLNKNKNIGIGLAAAALVAVVGYMFYSSGSQKSSVPTSTSEPSAVTSPTTTTKGGTQIATTSRPITTTKPPVKKPGASASAPKQYVVDAAKFKASGYYIQIYPGCQATPGTLTVKKGSQVMFDNRNSKGHTIAYKGVNHWLAAYGYAVLTFSSTGDNYVTCDGGGSAKVVVVP